MVALVVDDQADVAAREDPADAPLVQRPDRRHQHGGVTRGARGALLDGDDAAIARVLPQGAGDLVAGLREQLVAVGEHQRGMSRLADQPGEDHRLAGAGGQRDTMRRIPARRAAITAAMASRWYGRSSIAAAWRVPTGRARRRWRTVAAPPPPPPPPLPPPWARHDHWQARCTSITLPRSIVPPRPTKLNMARPPPRQHQVRYFGVFANHHHLRERVAPQLCAALATAPCR